MKKVAIIGGGLAGLVASIELSKKGVPCTLYEKKSYPMQRVCGEYISNEARDYLASNNLLPPLSDVPQISVLQLSSVRGRIATIPLDLGGFGLSRWCFDHFLYAEAKKRNVLFRLNTEVSVIEKSEDKYEVKTEDQKESFDLVIGAFGKRSRIDIAMKREFISRRSPFVGVKYHTTTPHDENVVALHNFQGGYCGVARVEGGKTNVCYLVSREILQQSKDIPGMEERILSQNPFLRSIFLSPEMQGRKPTVINEISFATKKPIEDGILMAGDSAGMVVPAFGNGMAIAIHSGKLAGELASAFAINKITRSQLEMEYTSQWRKNFRHRLWLGRQVQRLFGSPSLSEAAIRVLRTSPSLASWIVRRSHGDVF